MVQLAPSRETASSAAFNWPFTAMLVSSHFLFRVELDPGPAKSQPYLLNNYELASRLSYFLYSSMPDDELLAATWQGNLDKPEVLIATSGAMLKDPKSMR